MRWISSPETPEIVVSLALNRCRLSRSCWPAGATSPTPSGSVSAGELTPDAQNAPNSAEHGNPGLSAPDGEPIAITVWCVPSGAIGRMTCAYTSSVMVLVAHQYPSSPGPSVHDAEISVSHDPGTASTIASGAVGSASGALGSESGRDGSESGLGPGPSCPGPPPPPPQPNIRTNAAEETNRAMARAYAVRR